MTEGDSRAHDAVALRLERAIRNAARDGNLLLPAAQVISLLGDTDEGCRLDGMLRSMGAQRGADPARSDMVFADRADDAPSSLPSGTVFVGLDGSVRPARGTGPAARIAWAKSRMGATAEALSQLVRQAPVTRERLLVSMVLEPKTAAFALALADAGFAVAVFGACAETDPEVARALAATGSVTVFAPQAPVPPEQMRQTDADAAAQALAWAPTLLIDDGAHLIRLAHTDCPEALRALRGGAEETTSGVRPLREMDTQGELAFPVIAVNDAQTKTEFDNRLGTGQSCVFAIADVLDAAGWVAPGIVTAGDGGADRRGYSGQHGLRWTVIGFGPVGEGVAQFAAALGAEVTVVEPEPVRALAALHRGYRVEPVEPALRAADVVVSATGVWHTLEAEMFRWLRAGCAVAVAGGIDDELALEELAATGWTAREVAAQLVEWRAPGVTAGPLVLAGGGGVNYTAGEGNPVEIMDLSFATQVVALHSLLTRDLAPGLHDLDRADVQRVAAAALAAKGVRRDAVLPVTRPGGARQHWSHHRYRLDSDE